MIIKTRYRHIIKSNLIVTNNCKTINSRDRVALGGAKTTTTMPYYGRILLHYMWNYFLFYFGGGQVNVSGAKNDSARGRSRDSGGRCVATLVTRVRWPSISAVTVTYAQSTPDAPGHRKPSKSWPQPVNTVLRRTTLTCCGPGFEGFEPRKLLLHCPTRPSETMNSCERSSERSHSMSLMPTHVSSWGSSTCIHIID